MRRSQLSIVAILILTGCSGEQVSQVGAKSETTSVATTKYEQEAVISEQQIRQKAESLELNSIMQLSSGRGNVCLIGSNILYTGDSVEGFKVRRITDNSVTLEWDPKGEGIRSGDQTGGIEIILKMPEQGSPLLPEPGPQVESMPRFTHLRRFKPNNIQNGYGADILLKDELSEKELVSLLKRLAGSHDPVVIRIFTSHIAYAQEQNDNYGPEYDSDYILFFVRNLSGRGAYRNCNEIRWMQATGKFSVKFGTKTRF
jgi:hypothetical protein